MFTLKFYRRPEGLDENGNQYDVWDIFEAERYMVIKRSNCVTSIIFYPRLGDDEMENIVSSDYGYSRFFAENSAGKTIDHVKA